MHMKYWLHGTISFARRWVTFGEYFTGKGAAPANHCQKTTVIVVSCGIKICAVHHFVLSQCMRLTDGRTDRQAELRQQYRALHYMQSHGKKNSRFVIGVERTKFRKTYGNQRHFTRFTVLMILLQVETTPITLCRGLVGPLHCIN